MKREWEKAGEGEREGKGEREGEGKKGKSEGEGERRGRLREKESKCKQALMFLIGVPIPLVKAPFSWPNRLPKSSLLVYHCRDFRIRSLLRHTYPLHRKQLSKGQS